MKNRKVSILFRKKLKDELPVLQDEGLINQEQYKTISNRYRLDNLARESTSKLLLVIYSIGVFLIGIGVISFVAYHWNAMSKELKITLISLAMLASHAAGFYLWKISGKSPKLGHALVCLGTLIFGANIGLIAQIFHIKSQWNSGFLPWAIGAIIMAYAVGSIPNALIAIITSFIWFIGQVEYDSAHLFLYPLVAAVLFTGFAYLHRSALTFTMMLLSLAISVPTSLSSDSYSFGAVGGMLVIGLLFFCWGLLLNDSEKYKAFTTPSIILGTVSTLLALYLCSFVDFANMVISDTNEIFLEPARIIYYSITPLIVLIIFPFASIKNWEKKHFQIIMFSMAASLLLITTTSFIDEIMLSAAANIMLLTLASVFIWTSRFMEDRRLFWAGVLIIGLMTVSRTFEYETELLTKSIVFTACGAGIMLAGIMFEKYLKTRRIADD